MPFCKDDPLHIEAEFVTIGEILGSFPYDVKSLVAAIRMLKDPGSAFVIFVLLLVLHFIHKIFECF